MSITLPPELAQFTAQEIQLELMRRATFNAYDGYKMAAFLLQHTDLWEAALFDRIFLLTHATIPTLHYPQLIQLRDLNTNHWNADTLYILTASEAQREALINLGHEHVWYREHVGRYDEEHTQLMLGWARWPNTYRIFSYWWD